MEYLNGGDLRDAVAHKKQMTRRLWLFWFKEMLKGEETVAILV
jgi:hypothetical protein